MKRFPVIFLLILGAISFGGNTSAQPYTPLDLSEGATWAHTECGHKPDWGAVYKLKIYGDTILQGHVYRKLYYQFRRSSGICETCNFTFNKDSSQLFALIRQDEIKRRVYFIYPQVSEKEWLAYNFDIGSVGQYITGFSLVHTTQPEGIGAALYVYQLEVDAIDSVCLNGEYVKRYYFGPGNGGNPYHFPEYWIEGLGSTHGLLVQGFGGPEWLQRLYCFHNKNGGVFYDSTAIMNCIAPNTLSCEPGIDCSPITAIPVIPASGKLGVYPNPVGETLIVECREAVERIEMRCTDFTGRTVWQYTILQPDELNPVAVGELPSGFYILTITAGSSILSQKLIRR